MKATSTGQVPPALPPFNHEAFLARVNNDLDQVLDLIELFLEVVPDSLQRIEAAVQRKDAEAIRETAHQFKGSLKYMHAEPAVAAALRLEQLGRKHQADEAAEAFADLAARVKLLGHELRAFLASKSYCRAGKHPR